MTNSHRNIKQTTMNYKIALVDFKAEIVINGLLYYILDQAVLPNKGWMFLISLRHTNIHPRHPYLALSKSIKISSTEARGVKFWFIYGHRLFI